MNSCQAIIPSISIGSLNKIDSLDKELQANILNIIINDEVYILAKNDGIILKIGS